MRLYEDFKGKKIKTHTERREYYPAEQITFAKMHFLWCVGLNIIQIFHGKNSEKSKLQVLKFNVMEFLKTKQNGKEKKRKRWKMGKKNRPVLERGNSWHCFCRNGVF